MERPEPTETSQELAKRGFEVQRLLGQGSYGKVFLVKRTSDGKLYALKEGNVGRMSQLERMDAMNEIRLLASVKYQHVVRYYEAFAYGDQLCIVQEYANGGDLQAVKKAKIAKTPIPEKNIWKYLIQTCKGLQYLHDHKILHRDIKPANIFIADGEVIKVGDLGVAKLIRDGEAKTQIGTPHFMPPELWLNKPYSYSSDMWALGCCLYELMTFKVPFEAKSVDELRVKVLNCQMRPIPTEIYSADLLQVVACLLQYSARRRPSAAKVLASTQVARSQQQEQPPAPADYEAVQLLKTIRLPANIKSLQNVLPPAAYDAHAADSEEEDDGLDLDNMPNLEQLRLHKSSESDKVQIQASAGPAAAAPPKVK